MTEAREATYLYLTTTGRRSGLPREIEIWFTRHDERYYIISEHSHRAHWVQNLLGNPRVRWRVGPATLTGRARLIDPVAEPNLNKTIQALSWKKYGWGDGLVVELIPDPLP
ncbi:MAG TPA: nitroreductase family deazaflavin-dependent oxidoreductase [Candidatus Methylomirabilis sp.]|nr:nitroreductase family deazaflavin-dependent oxidoreductase [Candidatus Methylomirabilis sp.]